MPLTLVVAGSAEDRAVLEEALASAVTDTRIDVAIDAYHAIELARRIRPDAVVIDPAVPGLTPLELLARLKETVPGSPVLCWTAKPDVDEASELLRAGAAAYLLKHDGPAGLVEHLPAVVEGGVVIAPPVAAGLAERFTESIHHQAELSRALEQATKRLEAIESAKEAFIDNVNRELRTPMTIVRGIAHLLKNGTLSEEEESQFVERMDAAVENLTEMIEEMLSLSELGTGKVALEPHGVDMAELLERVCDRIEETYPDATLERNLPGSLPVQVDAPRISEAMAELLDNACRYSPPGGKVLVSLRRVPEGVTFSVTDFGEGLHREVLAQAFHGPFVTGEETLRKERTGLGVGLHLARQLVMLHGGIMWADPLPSGGTRIAFCIPERPAEAMSGPEGLEPAVVPSVPYQS